MPGDERTQELELIADLLSSGSIEPVGRLPNASNAAFVVRVENGREGLTAVYKPRAGEAPLWDFPQGTLCNRERAAFEISRILGWPAVPPTVIRDGPSGPGSVQLWIDFDEGEHYFTLAGLHDDEFRRIALFDAVVNNADRKSGHCLIDAGGRIWVIDHGVCFSVEPKLRTVIWEFAGEPIPPDLIADTGLLVTWLREDGRAALAGLLSDEEILATSARAAALIESGVFPGPGPQRHYPWPPV